MIRGIIRGIRVALGVPSCLMGILFIGLGFLILPKDEPIRIEQEWDS